MGAATDKWPKGCTGPWAKDCDPLECIGCGRDTVARDKCGVPWEVWATEAATALEPELRRVAAEAWERVKAEREGA